MNARAKPPASGEPEVEQVGLDELELPAGSPRPGALAGPGEHRGSTSTAVTAWPASGERDGDPAAARGQLEDRPVGAVGEREVQVEVARVVLEVEVVEPGERAGGGGIGRLRSTRAAGSQRTVLPGCLARRRAR